MAEEIEHVLYKLLPLILIIFVSWFFSFLGSRVKKQTQQAPEPQKTEGDREAAQLLFDEEEAMEPPKPAQSTFGLPLPAQGAATPAPMLPQASGPLVTPKPIKPKWWGA
jgi:hypothetical protein